MTPGLATPAARPRRASWLVHQDWFFAFALALFVGVAVWFSRAVADFLAPSGQTIAAPALVGETLSDAVSTVQRMHLSANVLQREPSDRYPKDVVMRQDPPPGAQVRQGRQISIVVSSGVQIFAMPDLRYESLREVGLELSHEKLTLGKVKVVQSDEVPANYVVSQDPLPLSSVRVGTVVDVAVSRGGPPAVRVPNFVNMDVDEARQAAQDAHVRLGQIVWTPFGRYGPPRGTVVRQSPGFNAIVDPLESVSLQISAGPREAGYLIRQVHATVTVPEDAGDADHTPTVRVQVRDETGTWNVYDAYADPKQKLDFNLTVVGTAEVDTFVNNELIDATKLGVEPPIQEKQTMGPPPPGSHPPKPSPSPSLSPSLPSEVPL